MKILPDNHGGIDIQAWIIGIIGFTTVWVGWTTFTPVIDQLTTAVNSSTLNLPIQSKNLATLISWIWNNAMILNGAGWLVYIGWSSVKVEIEERELRGY